MYYNVVQRFGGQVSSALSMHSAGCSVRGTAGPFAGMAPAYDVPLSSCKGRTAARLVLFDSAVPGSWGGKDPSLPATQELWRQLLRTLRSVADKHGVSVANVALRWVLLRLPACPPLSSLASRACAA